MRLSRPDVEAAIWCWLRNYEWLFASPCQDTIHTQPVAAVRTGDVKLPLQGESE
jgi:hypothetical protein